MAGNIASNKNQTMQYTVISSVYPGHIATHVWIRRCIFVCCRSTFARRDVQCSYRCIKNLDRDYAFMEPDHNYKLIINGNEVKYDKTKDEVSINVNVNINNK